MSPIARYRVTIIGTGCAALLGSVAVELLDLVPRSYSFEHWQMTIIPHAVKLTQTPTLVGLTAGSFLMILGPGLMMSRQQDAIRDVERRSALQTWHLKHLLPDEAHEPVSRTGV